MLVGMLVVILSIAALATSSFVVSGLMLVPQRIRRAQKIPGRRWLIVLRLWAQIMLGGVDTRILFKLARLSIWLLSPMTMRGVLGRIV